MEDINRPTRKKVIEVFKHRSDSVISEFENAWDILAESFTEAQLSDWASVGLGLTERSERSDEVANAFFAASPAISELMPFGYFIKWAKTGSALSEESPAIALAYFSSSRGAMNRLRSRHIENWAGMGKTLYKGTWKSGNLSTAFFETSPKLLDTITVKELETFVAFIEILSRRSTDVAAECLVLSTKVFPLLDHGKELFINLARTQTEANWRQTKALFDISEKALVVVNPSDRMKFLELTGRLLDGGHANPPVAMMEISKSLSELDAENHVELLSFAEKLLDTSPSAVIEFIKSGPRVLSKITLQQLDRWFAEGTRLLSDNDEAGLAFFKMESAHSQDFLETLSSSVEFDRVSGTMEMYCCALAGANVKLAASTELAEKNIGWVSDEAPSTEGSTVYLPQQVDKYPSKEENFSLLKVVSTHQVAHLEFGSFDFEYERPSTKFTDLRPKLQNTREIHTDNLSQDDSTERLWLTDMQRFFDMFAQRALALDVFTVIEDGRLDNRVKSEYVGITSVYTRVQIDAINDRPDFRSLPAQEALIEFLVRFSLTQKVDGLEVPTKYHDEARRITVITKRVLTDYTTVEDTAEATIRIYNIISKVPNEEVEEEDWTGLDMGEETEDEETDSAIEDLLQELMEQSDDGDSAHTKQEYTPSEDVDYRGDFKPEIVQLLSQIRSQQSELGTDDAQQISQEMLEEVLENTAELDHEAIQTMAQGSSETLSENMLKQTGQNALDSPQTGQGSFSHADEEGGSLDSIEPQTFTYDEWDFRANDYKPRWCMVHQKLMAEGDPDYYGTTLGSYGTLATQIRRQFELLVPEMFRKTRKLQDGEEIDIDDVIEAFIDIKTGVGPSEKLYWRRNKIQRDVAVAFLLDTSASTAEAIEDTRGTADEWEAPEDPVDYIVWLRNRRGEGNRRTYKRIIDLEKEAVVLIIHALEAIGDLYGIYGFSGYGRENVEFYTIKDIGEGLSERVKRRVDRIAPLHATRMGPAIRHATTKLEGQEARTKLLFLISDGRPQDRGYSREGVEKEYAVHDTKMALDEAKSKQINAFCLTVDKNGHDYLKTMCEDIGYEVLDNIHELPRRLLQLYKSLTM